MTDPTPILTESQEEHMRLTKLNDLRNAGVEPFAYSYSRTHTLAQIHEQFSGLAVEEKSTVIATVAGRILAKRGHGKAFFGNIQDESSNLQFYAKQDVLGETLYDQLLSFDVGDFIGIQGQPFRTKRGELSISVDAFTLLTKSLHPLPEKFHGLTDKETRYRQRYVDLIANRDVFDVFKKRSDIVHAIRDYLHTQAFMEVETPVLHAIYGGAAARPFKTHHNELGQDLYLRIALELHLKRLIVGGYERVYEIGRVFRNEGVSYKHNPEFTMLELYQAYADYNDMMTLCENLLAHLAMAVHGSYEFEFQGQTINFKPPFKRLTMIEALQHYAGVDNLSVPALQAKCREIGLELTGNEHKGELINTIYDKYVEHNLIQPTFILDYPWETSPLAKRKRGNPDLVERFELIVNGIEFANAFSELNDPIDQYDRFVDQLKAKESGYEDAQEMDEDYVNALKYGMPPTGGIGIGIDRVVMLLTNASSIRDVLFFPHMKTRDTEQ